MSALQVVRKGLAFVFLALFASHAQATTFTTTVPGTGITLPADYPEAGGVAIVMVGVNGNTYYQFSDPTGAFRGYQYNGTPTAFRGNPFTINDPIALNCGFSTCADYFGGSIAQIYIRFSAYDGDTQPGGFDFNRISLVMNGYTVGNWSDLTTERTNNTGSQSFGFESGFGNNSFNTGWFSSTNSALLNNILTTGRTTTQVFDATPNDNYWDFRRGPSLSNSNVVTVAPGYEFEKTADRASFSAVGETITYTYRVTNIGSVPIRNLTVQDDRIANVTCDKTTIFDTNPGGTADFATCTGTYTVTQQDVDAQSVTNIAQANGVPDEGTLGAVQDSVTVTGPALNPVLTVDKTSPLAAFGAVGSQVPYTIRISNTGNTTLSDIAVTDSLIAGFTCTPPDLLPGAFFDCTGSYTVQQSDIDTFAQNTGSSANWLNNLAQATARTPAGGTVSDSDALALPGPAPVLDFTFDKTATTADFDSVGDQIGYEFVIVNTGTVTLSALPTITDPQISNLSCPAGPLAPGGSAICTASYTVDQDDLDAGQVVNTASAQITQDGLTASQTDSATVDAVITTGLAMSKRLAAGSASSFDAVGDTLLFEFELLNTGNTTLDAVQITDPLVGVTCPAMQIAPGASLVCTSAPYAVTQADLNAGGVTNTATVTVTEPATGTPLDASGSVTVPADQRPALTLTKSAPNVPAPQFQVGRTISYDFDVTNTGNVAFSTAVNGVDLITITDDKIGTFDCGATPLAVGQTLSCSADYVLTAADVAAGQVTNTATAAAGATLSNQESATIAPDLSTEISLAKTVTSGPVTALGDTITYQFEVVNEGTAQIVKSNSTITVTDPALTAFDDCVNQPDFLNPGDSFLCFGQRVGVTQAEFDSGAITNTAVAAVVDGGGVVTTSNSASAETPVVASPSMVFTKSVAGSFAAVGDTLTYTFTVENTGPLTLSSVAVSDPRVALVGCDLTNLAPGATTSCTGTYQVTQADLDAGQVQNTATAIGSTRTGQQVTHTDTAVALIDPGVVPQIALTKSADRSSFIAAGEVVTYRFSVENTGVLTIDGATVTDALVPGYSCAIGTLAPGAVSDACTLAYTVTQDDVDAGQIDNSAQVTAPGASDTDTLTLPGPARIAAFTLDKTADVPAFAQAGETVTYTFTVTNSGTVTLSNVAVDDPFFGSPISCAIGTLLPGQTSGTACTAIYTIDQADVDAGQLDNTATATGDAPPGVAAPAPQSDSLTLPGPAEAPALTVTKAAEAGAGFAGLGDTETYTFRIENTGNVTLVGLTLDDADLGLTCALPDLAPGDALQGPGDFCADGTTPLTATKTFDQADIDRGSYVNTVSVKGQTAGQGSPVSGSDSVTVTGPAQAPALSIAKTFTSVAPSLDLVGQTLEFAYDVTNSGNITITAPISVDDDKIASVQCPELPPSGLAPGAAIQCTGAYVVTQADLDAGSVTNIASASVTQPLVPQNPGDPAFAFVTSTPDSVTVGLVQDPALRLEKRVKSTSPSSYAAVGDTIVFEYVVTNDGNVTTTDPILVTDSEIPGTLTCSAAPLAPGDSVTCEQTWSADQAALDAGSVTNLGTATTLFDGAPVTATDTATVNAVQTAALGVVKTLQTVDGVALGALVNPTYQIGQVLGYEIIVSNPGNVTIAAPFTFDDSLVLSAAINCGGADAVDLAPGANFACSASHTVTQNDIDLGAATNVVRVSGSFDGAPVVSPADDAIYPVDASPALSLVKEVIAGPAAFGATTDVYTYRFTVTNTGNVDLTGQIGIADDKIGAQVCKAAAGGGVPALTVGGSITCEFDYTVTQADLDAGILTNVASAETLYPPASPSATRVTSPEASASVTADTNPGLLVQKSLLPGTPDPAAAGDLLQFEISATNSGNQTLSGVTINDPLLPALSCAVVPGVGGVIDPAPANVVLAPGDRLSCTGSYRLGQADFDGQSFSNTASAQGTSPQGVTVSGSDTLPVSLAAPLIQMSAVKSAFEGDPFDAPGQEVKYRISVTNQGNITLTDLRIDDVLDVTPASCTIATLAPGATDSSCVFTYVVTQADIDRPLTVGADTFGVIDNTATVTATPAQPGQPDIVVTAPNQVRGPLHEPALTLVKSSAATAVTAWDEVVTYTFTVANTGNITLFDVPQITDDKIGTFACAGLPVGGLAPNESYDCTATYRVTQDDLDAGAVTNTATVTSPEVPPGAPEASDSLTIPVTQTPGLSLTKLPSASVAGAAGEVITYTYTVTNTGNVSLQDVTVSDQHSSAAGTIALAVGGESLSGDVQEIGTSIDAVADNGVWSVLKPGDSASFSATYEVTQDDIDQQVTLENTATVTGTGPAGTTPPVDSATASVPTAAKTPALEVTKTADAGALSDPAQLGEQVGFTITVTNTGNQTLTAPVLTDTLNDADGGALALDAVPVLTAGDANGNGALDLGEAWVYTASFTLTQPAIDAGGIENTVTATAQDPQGQPVTDTLDAPVTVALSGAPGLALVKTATLNDGGDGRADAGDTITYSYTVTNTGNQTLFDLAVSETGFAGAGSAPVPTYASGGADLGGDAAVIDLAPGGGAVVFTGTYTLTQDDLDAGSVTNQATASGTDPDGAQVSDLSDDDSAASGADDPTVTPLPGAGALDVQKRADLSALGTPPVAGETLGFVITVENTGNQTLTDLALTDTLTDADGNPLTLTTAPALVSGDTDGDGALDVGEVWTYRASYVLEQAALDAGGVANSVTVSARDAAGGGVGAVSDDDSGATDGNGDSDPANDPTAVPLARAPALELVKTPSVTEGAAAGDVIAYSYAVTNTGNQTVSAISIADDHSNAGGTIALAVAGEALTTDAAPADDSTDTEVNGSWDSLAPGDVVTFSASYTVTQADIDAQAPLENIATLTAQSADGAPVGASDSASVTLAPPAPALTAVKTVDTAGLSTPPVAGETLPFTITVANTGNQSLTGITLRDTLRRNDGTVIALAAAPVLLSGDGGVAGVLEVGETWTYGATHEVSQDDIDAGGVSNQVEARGLSPDGAIVSDLSDDGVPANGDGNPTLVAIPAAPGIEGEKRLVSAGEAPGSVLEFVITVTNTGNVTLSDVAIDEDSFARADGTVVPLATPVFTGASQGSSAGLLLPGEVATYTVSHVLTQADIDAGGVRNSARVVGTPPVGSPLGDITDDGDDADGNTSSDPTEYLIAPEPALALVKRLDAASPGSFAAVGDSLLFAFDVTNSGNVTVTDPVVIDDPLIDGAGGRVACPALPVGGLAPGATLTCTGSYAATQDDLDAGAIDNTATARAGSTRSDPASTTVAAVQSPALELVKTAQPVPATAYFTGAEITYTYTVTNSGNVTLAGPFTVTDNLIDPADLSCDAVPAGGLAPGDSLTCTGVYTVTATDVDLGSVTNLASVSDGVTRSPVTSETIPDAGVPALSLVKSAAPGTGFAEVGDTIDYSFTVTNSGTRSFAAPVVVEDSLLGQIACFTPSASDPDLVAGETVSCTGTYTVTQADLDAGAVVNEAFASTAYGPDDTLVTSPPDRVTTPATLAPALSLAKSAAPLPVTAPGQVLTFTLAATNTGNQTLRAVSVSDPMLPGLVCATDSLARGASLECSAPYTVTQADIDAGALVNAAFARATTPLGDDLRDDTTLTVAMPSPAPALALTKTATPSPFGPVGSTLGYRLSVENTGNVTLFDIVLSDPLAPSLSCTVARLAPGAVDGSCAFDLTVTQAMVDAGAQDNTARATGRDPFGTIVDDSVAIRTEGPAAAPAIEATKTLAPAASVAGEVLRYRLVVENTGNVSIASVVLTDTMQRLDGTPIALDAPFSLVSGDVDGDGILDVGEAWVHSASYTLTQDDLNAGGLRNQVTATGRAPDGSPVSDLSDNGDDTDGNSTDDATRFDAATSASLEVAKRVTATGAIAGDVVEFEISALNTGNQDLTDLALSDRMTRADGTPLPATPVPVSVPDPLSPGATATWRLSHVLTQPDIDAGGLANSAVVSGLAPDDTRVSDVSADDDASDGNTVDDATEIAILPSPGVEVVKRVTSAGAAAGEPVSFEITVENTGTVTLTGIGLTDTLSDIQGADPRNLPVSFVGASGSPPSPQGTLLPGEVASYTATHVLTQADIDAGGVANQVTATATTPQGGSLVDVSDDDGVGADDPTAVPIAPMPSFDVVKTVATIRPLFTTVDEVTFDIAVTNTGNITQTGISLRDDLAAFVAPATLRPDFPPTVSLSGFDDASVNPGFDGVADTELLAGNPTLAPGQTGTARVTLVYATATGQPAQENVAAASSDQLATPETGAVAVENPDADGDGVPDLIEGTGDRDGDGIADASDYDPTGYFYCEDTGAILAGGQITVSGNGFSQTGVGTSGPITIVRDGSAGFYQFHVTDAGTYVLGLSYPPAGDPSTARSSLGSLDVTTLLPANPAALGAGESGATGRLADFSAGANPFYNTFVVEPGDPFVLNNNIPLTACAQATDVVATKTADRQSAVFGETLTYTLTFRNDSTITHSGARIVDILPPGLLYTPGSARVDGAAQEPAIAGRQLSWLVDIAPAQSITVTLAARVVAADRFGVLTNRTWLEAPGGARLSNEATADIRVEPEAVFDCSDVIGKVFDDRNRNGYQDGPGTLPEPITDDSYAGGKGKLAPRPRVEDRTERGLPGVRLVAPDGTLVTTDAHGRYSVPCAALPRDIGSNFMLKLDTRTLPTGYRVTTENPRVVRLTAGKMAKLNFGAALGDVVDIDLTARAFAAGGVAPVPGLARGIDAVLAKIGQTPTALRLTYLLQDNEAAALGRERLRAVEKLIRGRWQGGYRLEIEKTVTRGR